MTTYRVNGMTCGHCAKTVETAARTVTGVSGARVELKAGTLTIEGNADKSALQAAVAESGYDLEA